jgi:uncharacterized cupredoxin-like copper-binding protein
MIHRDRLHAVTSLVMAALIVTAPPLRAQVAAEQVHYVRVVAKDYAFDAAPSVPAGIVTFHLLNQGADVHHLMLVELPPGHSVKEFVDTMRDKGEQPAWTVTVGATPIIQKNHEAFLTLRLPPGRYMLSCLIPAKDGRSHAEKGMFGMITVTAEGRAAPAPKAARKP